jgi:hypothetical protein
VKIEFAFGWMKTAGPASKAFKLDGARLLFEEYAQRIHHFAECKWGPLPDKPEPGSQLWLCHFRGTAKILSSEDLSAKIEKIRDSGIRKLTVAIGGPDGFTPESMAKLQPDFQWSFGPMTLPHELAAVVAAEQIYRAWTILNNLPYHKGH